MPNNTFNSPNIFTSERDESFINPSPTFPGACFIGLSNKGQAFVPIQVSDWQEFTTRFGNENSSYYMPYAVKGYLKHNSPATIIRVLGKSNYTSLQLSGSVAGTVIYLINSQSVQDPTSQSIVFAEIYTNGTAGKDWNLVAPATTSDNFAIAYTGSDSVLTTVAGLSLDPTNNNYFKKAFNTSPIGASGIYQVKGGYNWNYIANVPLFLTASALSLNPGKYDASEGNLTKYNNARTTWIQSQNYGPDSASITRFDLFRIHNLSDGDSSNTEFKVSIANIQSSPNISSSRYGSFDVYVRDFADTDDNPLYYEQHTNLSLDPTADNYIANVIGNYKRIWDNVDGHFSESGEYSQKSRYIRVEMSEDLDNVPQDAVPYAFAAYPTPVGRYARSGSVITAYPAPLPTASITNVRGYFGIDFTKDIKDGLQVALTHSIGSGAASSSTDFISGAAHNMYYSSYDLGLETSCSIDNTTAKGKNSGHLSSSAFTKWRKFTIPLYKGWDALDWGDLNTYTLGNLSTNLQNGYLDAMSIIKNDEEVDVNDIFIPGVSDSTILDQAITNIESRADSFLILDAGQKTDTIATVQSAADRLDSSYACTYFPWVQIQDTKNNKYVYVPPSVMVAEVFAYSDKVANQWTAPAGTRRGKTARIIDTYLNLTNQDRDDLYTHDINPIANFKNGDGIVVWGNKTLQKSASKLDRINVRRLLIRVKRFVKQVSMRLVFEQNGPELWNQFISEVDPFLADIKNKKGLYSYQIIMDDTLNNADTESRRTLVGAIRLNPQVAIEYLDVGFIISNTGVNFSS